MYLQDAGPGRQLLRATSDVRSRGRGPMELRGTRNGRRTMRVNQRIYRAGGGHLDVRTAPRLHFTDVGAYFGGSYWKVHELARFELRRATPTAGSAAPSAVGPKLNYCLRDLERTRPGRHSPANRHYPGCNQNPYREPRHPRHLGRLVGHLPRRLRQAVDQRHRPARLLRLRDDRRPTGTCSSSPTSTTTPRAAWSGCRSAARPAASRGRPRPGRWPGRRRRGRPGGGSPSRRPSSIAAMSTTVEGRPVSSPPSIARSTRRGSSAGRRAKSRRSRLAAEVGRGLEDRAHGAGQRAVDQADAEPLDVLAAGQRVAVAGVGDDQRHRARQQGADRGGGARAEPGDQLPHRQRREVHDRRGLAVVAALEPVDPRDRRRRRADRRRARRGRRRGRRRRRRRRCSAPAPSAAAAPSRSIETKLGHPRSAAPTRAHWQRPHHDPLDPGQVAPHLDLGEAGRRAAARRPPRPAPPPPPAPPRRDRTSCAYGGQTASSSPSRAPIASRPSGPASSASRGSHSVTSGCRAGQSRSAT